MKKITFSVMLAAILGFAVPAPASYDSFGLAWSVSLPLGDTADYIPRVSFRGASVEWRHYYQRDNAYGLNVGWYVFNKETASTMESGDLTATGNLWQYINAVPVYAGWVHFFETDPRSMRAYFGINGGAAWVERRTDLGLLRLEESNWHVALAPELGVSLPYNWFLGYVGLRYHYAFAAGEAEAQQWLELKIGFGLD